MASNEFIGGVKKKTEYQCIAAGLVDEIQIHLAPILLGEGRRLFDHLGTEPIEPEPIRVVDAPGVTPLRFRVRQRR